LWKELVAGNDLKMPTVTAADADMAVNSQVDMDKIPLVPRSVLETSARRILQLIMKSYTFKNQRFDAPLQIPESGSRVDVMQLCNISHSGVGVMQLDDLGSKRGILYNIKSNYWRCETALYYLLQFEKSGAYALSFNISTSSDSLSVKVLVNDKIAGEVPIRATSQQESSRIFEMQGDLSINFQANTVYRLKLLFEDPQNQAAALEHLVLKRV
jgi:hypothetical protein